MKTINNYIFEKLHLNKNIKVQKYNYHPKDRDELAYLVDKLIKERGNEADLNDIDISNMTDMHFLFYYSEFNGDILEWDVSNVKYMEDMFKNSPLEKNPPAWYHE